MNTLNKKLFLPISNKKSFFYAAMGTTIEYYDCVLFIIFLPIISPIFFPSSSPHEALVKGYYVLLFSSLARPFGGLFFGYIGDTLGRRTALLGAIYGIAIATLLIGLVPSHEVIGMSAAVGVIILKSIQIFCFGGEYNGAGVYVVEHAQKQNESTSGALLSAMTLVGSLVASLIGVICTTSSAPTWSWRAAFVLGGTVGLLGVFYRKNLLESPEFIPADLHKFNFKAMIAQYPKQLVAGVFIGGFSTVPFTTVLTFINPLLVTQGALTSHQVMWLQTLLSLIAIIALIVTGRLADKKTPTAIMLKGSLLLIIFSLPLMYIIEHSFMLNVIIAQCCFIIINQLILGSSNAYIKNLFITQYRYRASSLSFCIGMSVLGGLTPIIENNIYQATHHLSLIAIWPIVIGIGTFVSIKVANIRSRPFISAPANIKKALGGAWS